jgi:heat shock protein HslJ
MRTRAITSAAVLILALTGCSDDGDPSDSASATGSPTTDDTAGSAIGQKVTTADLAATSYVSTRVTGQTMVEGTEVLLVFELGTMAASAGCNTMFGDYQVDDGILRWSSGPAQTLKACPDELAAQDAWVAALLTDGASATVDGSNLTLTSGEVTLELTEQSPGRADLSSLLGRTWVVVGTMADGAAQRLPRRNRPPSIGVRANGFSRLNTGCNTGRTVVRVRDDAFVFGPTTTTRQRCRQPEREIQRRFLAVLDGRTDTVDVHDDTLVVTKGRYGLVFDIS